MTAPVAPAVATLLEKAARDNGLAFHEDGSIVVSALLDERLDDEPG